MRVQLKDGVWLLGDRIGDGGYGRVLEARGDAGQAAVAKLVPKEPGAERELLFANLDDVRNVVPIIDSGETDSDWVLIMPRADRSLREHLDGAGGCLDPASTVTILQDIVTALVDLDGRVAHRDVKPENVLLLDGHWCLADFGISRYAEAATSADTRKGALSPFYAAPERWRNERATAATDVYSLGVIAYELLAGSRPFIGLDMHDLRDAHLGASPPSLASTPAALAALVEECLYKAPQARPSAANLVKRLERVAELASSPGLAALQEANRAHATQRAESARAASVAESEQKRRAGLFEAATTSFSKIAEAFKDALLSSASAAVAQSLRGGGWELRLGPAALTLTGPVRTAESVWGSWDKPAFDVVAHSSINLRIPQDRYGYAGREHSLWFCDAAPDGAGNYQWFETAFMVSPLVPKRALQDPFGLDPSEEAAKAIGRGITEWQLAWPFTPLTVGDLEEFISRWAREFAAASVGRLSHPSTMPECRPDGSFRRI